MTLQNFSSISKEIVIKYNVKRTDFAFDGRITNSLATRLKQHRAHASLEVCISITCKGRTCNRLAQCVVHLLGKKVAPMDVRGSRSHQRGAAVLNLAEMYLPPA